MNSVILVSLIALLSVEYSFADRKRCFCQARDDATGTVLKDFGTIDTHRHWLSVGCRRLGNCADKCDAKTKEWLCEQEAECERLSKGKKVVPYYKASVCSEGNGSNRRTCGCDANHCLSKCAAAGDNFTQCFLGCVSF
ncbi:hypothetical protein MAR_021769 [Mya arenaria]|uniref:Uncharacterized protein n=1 Tax=Mya arenaria TaxID=6604 RepID=A0ABY7EBL8_MYAAR|nr:hypothetical protein MAR_021769 [Mya arenaria]